MESKEYGNGFYTPSGTSLGTIRAQVFSATRVLEVAGLHDGHGDVMEAVVPYVQTGHCLHTLCGTAWVLPIGAWGLAHVTCT